MVHIAADVNAKELGIGYDVLAPLGMTFVLHQFGVSIARMPAYDEDVTIRTWPSDIIKGRFIRKGDMYDKNGVKIMEWASQWLLFDISARRLLGPSSLPVPLPQLGDEGVKIMPEKIVVPEGLLPFSYRCHTASYRDVDTNMHINNSIYGDLIGDAIFSDPTLETPMPDWKQVQINYLAEIRAGEEVEVSAYYNGDGSTINGSIVIGESKGRRAFVARVDYHT